MRNDNKAYWRATIILTFIAITLITEMCFYDKLFNKKKEQQVLNQLQPPTKIEPLNNVDNEIKDNKNTNLTVANPQGYTSGVYYSNWSPYSPRKHFPHDIDFSRISHVYYSFFLVNGDNGKVELGDKWSDIEMDLYKPLSIKLGKLKNKVDVYEEPQTQSTIKTNLPKGCIGEFFYLRNSKLLPTINTENSKNFKMIMTIGGWSNRDSFPKMAKSPQKIHNFVTSAIEMMFEYGFDGIDLDWEFPKNNTQEPAVYLKIMQQLRQGMNELEEEIYKNSAVPVEERKHFQLSVASPAFEEKLSVLPIKEMNKVLDYWNMMTYDYNGEWSEKTGYHSNLYDGSKVKHDEEVLNADSAIKYMIETQGVEPNKLVLGLAGYGRGYTNVNVNHIQGFGKNNKERELTGDEVFIDLEYKGVGGESEGEPGMWMYNQLPIKGSIEQFDPKFVSAYCYDLKTNTLVTYDNVESMNVKGQYVKDKGLAGGFMWESCGDVHDNPKRSLITAFTNELGKIKKQESSIFQDEKTFEFYLEEFGNEGYLSEAIAKLLNKDKM
ncbi:hypothetical protein TBLA_0A02790 [Henningerozyma blattae CBS 6284]|uniref:chitinase n=1 Tax=Henningerozyma blattae (strain ATCC 34711 / CBS 6284 / DSM 70876 / NBRC 10599 / NRRL Y-10934 / UCD 77-7) TaxID=1071380 RepID=I2GVC5_HENB6|nr:hypothetical protein TBLA_0A02790 [Tetrapisispora blattae CBS 6284]CCH58077.1 hypothetical protein TBLA_0A02790 [Tetrapisispora blattae CBS 6284]